VVNKNESGTHAYLTPIPTLSLGRKSDRLLACASRYVDCESANTFKQGWEQVRARYTEDRHLASVSFAEVESAIDQVLAFFSQMDVFPLQFTLPPL